MEKFFKLKENGTTARREVVAGLTTFFAMAYILFVNPNILENADMNKEAVFLATILASVVGTLVMGLFANVPYAQAPGMGLNAFFTYVVVQQLGFNWKEALALVFICGVINIIITVTKIRKAIVKAIPESLQHAIGGGIGLFIAYIGFLNVGLIKFNDVPALTDFNNIPALVTVIGLILTIVLLLLRVKGAILIGIAATTILSIPLKVTSVTGLKWDILGPFKALPETFGQAFVGMKTLFSGGVERVFKSILAIFAFSLTDTFDTIGTFIGTGRKTGIFDDEDIAAIENSKGFKTKMERALFADSIATSVGAIFGTSNTTTYVESAAGIEAGGKTGLTSVVVAAMFLLSIVISPLVNVVPSAATSPALIIVGIMMASSFKEINWDELEDAVPAFLTVAVMTLAYNISLGIAFGFIFYVLVKAVKGKAKEVHPIIWGSAALFVVYFVLMALYSAAII